MIENKSLVVKPGAQGIGRNFLIQAAIILACALLLFSREPGHILYPQLWAEDGSVWLQQAYTYGPRSLLWPQAGYFQTLPRLIALAATAFPLEYAPIFFAAVAFIIQLLPAIFLLSNRAGAIVPAFLMRAVIVVYYTGEPDSSEVYVNLTNAMWHLAIMAFLVVVCRKPRTLAGKMFDIAIILLTATTGPFVILLTPIAWWHAWENTGPAERPAKIFYAALLTLGAFVQGLSIAANAGQARIGHLGVTLGRLAHILANHVFLGGTISAKNVSWLVKQDWWSSLGPALFVTSLAIAMLILAAFKGDSAFRKFLAFSSLVIVSALSSPITATAGPQWDVMQHLYVGGRYYSIPMLAWFTCLLVLASQTANTKLDSIGRWIARIFLAGCLAGLIQSWHFKPIVHSTYYKSAQAFENEKTGATVTFPESPAGWRFVLIKQ